MLLGSLESCHLLELNTRSMHKELQSSVVYGLVIRLLEVHPSLKI